MSQKAAIPDDDFKQYLEVLLGDRNDEKVMELMSKGPTRKKHKVDQTQGINYNRFAAQIAASHRKTCENWVDINGIPLQEEEQPSSNWGDVLYSAEKPDLQNIRLRDSDQFVAGGFYRNLEAWDRILVDHPQKDTIGDWIRNKIEISKFPRHFKGSYKGQHYCSDFPPSKQFSNHASCKAISDFVSKEILKRLTTDALRVWGQAGDG
ncbi:hypothetical protein AWC38_SpisGene24042 [Stylophora pistillata]|uniref:Uncharacterized protein n=1 Tax=Stylophora pistillata TaxID=50429 RepID=A0A2B4R5G6_STYPI|nr:hypothetical protein AWC38_SpisGene24042 [Stylophora pistillata]